eukprot:GHVO01004029.1.p1 GENE.GHVO01004029.1~~GHVO01004029.1.p1  ORF type:complete len:102 (-),score=2.18 GHVO01004029.1:426-731(-)
MSILADISSIRALGINLATKATAGVEAPLPRETTELAGKLTLQRIGCTNDGALHRTPRRNHCCTPDGPPSPYPSTNQACHSPWGSLRVKAPHLHQARNLSS